MRKYSPGHLARRIRRTLERHGMTVGIAWIDRPAYQTSMPERILETRVSLDGSVHVMHHSACVPGTDRDVDRIVHDVTVGDPGVRESEIDAVRARYGGAVRRGEGMWSLVTRYHGGIEARMRTLVPVDLLDIAGRTHPMVIDWAGSSDFKAHSWAMRHLECDRGRRDARGRPRPLRVGGGMAAVLRSRTDGLDRAERLLSDLTGIIDGADLGDDMSAVTLVKVKGGDAQVHWNISGRDIQVEDYRFTGGRMSGSTLVVDRVLPEQMLGAIPGRTIGEVVEGVPLDGGIVVKEAHTRRRPVPGTSLKLDLRPVPIDDLIGELRRRRT
jgi:hypothetical protein